MNKDKKQHIYDEGRRDGFYAGVRAERTLTASQIVRCRDCVYYEQDGIADSCTLFDFSMDCQYMQDGFCAWGDRRAE